MSFLYGPFARSLARPESALFYGDPVLFERHRVMLRRLVKSKKKRRWLWARLNRAQPIAMVLFNDLPPVPDGGKVEVSWSPDGIFHV